jgi:hydrogenase nickel incorporation protein HypA/HybF
MHELSIALALLDQLEALAAERGIARFERIELAAGVRRGIVPEALELAFREAARGGPAAEAELELTIVPAWARCRGCGHAFAPAIDDYLCARCGQADVEMLSGDDIVLSRVTGTADGAAEEVSQ